MATLHIVGAGLAGLAAAVAATGQPGRWTDIRLYEATAQAGGRCRSFFDERLGRLIDNGNHLLLGANRAALAYVEEIGGRLVPIRSPPLPMIDLETGERWAARPGIAAAPGLLRLALAGSGASVADALGATGGAFRRFWDPFATAVLNTAPDLASARLLRQTLIEILRAGPAGLVPWIADRGLSAALVDPALATLARRDVHMTPGARLRAVRRRGGRATAILIGDAETALGPGDALLLALPPDAAARLLPDLLQAASASPILNIHFRLPAAASLPAGAPALGLVGGTAQWAFVRDDLLSITVSAADALVEEAPDRIAARIWADLRRALPELPAAPPPCRVVKERRATPLQTPAWARSRPPADIGIENLRLAGDWVDTGLPATIESAVRSGRAAVRALAALQRRRISLA